MGTSVETSSKSCTICEGRVFSCSNISSDINRCLECRSVLAELASLNKSCHCTSSGCCALTRLTRFHCLYCFVKKCLRAGCATGCVWHQGLNNSGSFAPALNPSSEPVQIIDVEIDFGKQSLLCLATSSEEVGPGSSDPDNRAFDVYSAICKVAFSHLKFCPTTTEKLRGCLPLESCPSMVTMEDEEAEETLVPGSNADSRCCAVFCKLAGNMNSMIINIVELLRRLPGFERVAKDEQMNLLKGGFFKVWLLWSIPGFFGLSSRRLILSEDLYLTFSELSDVYGVEFVRSLLDFARNWSSLGLRDAEVGLCAGIVLSTMSLTSGFLWDCTGHIIQETNELLKRALHQLLIQNNPSKPNLTEDVLHLISNLDSISYAHSKFLQKFHNRWRNLGIMPLFAEVFDFHQPEETEIEVVSSEELDNEDMLCVEPEILEKKEVAGSPSDLSNQAEDIESYSELGNLGDVSSSDLMSNVGNESEDELENYEVPLQGDSYTVEEIFQSELGKDGETYRDTVEEDAFSRELNEYGIFPSELLSQDEDIFQDELSKDIFQRELSNDEIIFRNEVDEDDDVQIELTQDEDIFPSESRDAGV